MKKMKRMNWRAKHLGLSLAMIMSVVGGAAPRTLADEVHDESVALVETWDASETQELQEIYTDVLSTSYGKDTLFSVSVDLDSLATTNRKEQSGYYFYKIKNADGAVEALTGTEFKTATRSGTSIVDITLTVDSAYTVYIKPVSSTPTDAYIQLNSSTQVIADSLHFDGAHAMIIGDSANSAHTKVYLKGVNYAYSTSYAIDVKGTMTISDYDGTGTLYAQCKGGFNSSSWPGIRVNKDAHMIVDSGDIKAISNQYGSARSVGIGRSDGSNPCGSVTVNGGTVYAEGYVGIGGNVLHNGDYITINGGDVTAIGTRVGIGSAQYSTSTSAGDIVVNGGTVYAYGGVYAIQTYRDGNIYLNGGEITAYTGGTVSIGITSVSASYIAGSLFAKGADEIKYLGNNFGVTGSGAVLIRNGSIPTANSSTWNMALFNTGANQVDPYNAYYGGSSIEVASIDDDPLDIWYGRVYGDVTLQQDFVLGNRKIYVDGYDNESTQTPLASCDGMLLDIPTGTTLRHNDSTGNVSYLTIEGSVVNDVVVGSKLRFKGIYEETGTIEAPFLWGTSVQAPDGIGTISIVLSSEMLGDGNTQTTSGEEVSTYVSLSEDKDTGINTGTYNGKPVGFTTVKEAGRGSLWYANAVGPVSMSYRNDSTGILLGGTAIANAGTYTVTLQGSGDRSLSGKGYIRKVPQSEITLEFTGQGYDTFVIEPYDITSDNVIDVKIASGAADNIYITNEELSLNASNYVTVTNPFGGSNLLLGTDYVLSYEEVGSSTTNGAGDTVQQIKLVVVGVGNYTGAFTNQEASEQIEVLVTDGKLGSVDIFIDWDDAVASAVFVKPDGEADFSALQIKNVDDDVLYPSASTKLTAVAENVGGTDYYDITIEVVAVGDGFVQADVGEKLTFRVQAEAAGSGTTFDDGSLNLVEPFYQRPDGKIYSEDLLLHEDGTLLAQYSLSAGATLTRTYTVEYAKKANPDPTDDNDWQEWLFAVDSTALKNTTDGSTNTFDVRVTDDRTGAGQDKYIVFKAQWKTGGSHTGNSFDSGILYPYTNTTGTDPRVYVAEGYGVVLSTDKLGFSAQTYVVESGATDADDDILTPTKVDLTDKDFSFVANLADFTAYQDAVEANSQLGEFDKSYILWVDENGSSLSLSGTDSFKYFNKTDFDKANADGDITWYLCLHGAGDYTGSIYFQINPDHIVFLNILEDVVGLLDDQLLLDPNKYPSDKVYQKPDGTLHDEDLKTLMYRQPTLTSYALSEHSVSTVNYSVVAERDEAVKDSIVYDLAITGYEDSDLIDPTDGDGVGTIPLTVEAAGSGSALFRHGYIDMVEKQVISYVAASGHNDNDGDADYYTNDDLVEIYSKLEFFHGGNELKYGTDYTVTMYPELFEETTVTEGSTTVTIDNTTQTLNITLYNSKSSGDAVTFVIEIEMEEEEEGHIHYHFNNNTDGSATSVEWKMTEEDVFEFGKDDAATPVDVEPTYTGHTFSHWSLDEEGKEVIDATTITTENIETLSDLIDYVNNLGYATGNNVVLVYAQWETNEYTVSFDYNYEIDDPVNPGTDIGKGEYAWKSSTAYNDTLMFPTPNPERAGWIFEGWVKSATGTDILVEGADTFAEIAQTVDGSDPNKYTGTVYAKWTEMEPYHIYFSLNYLGAGLHDYTKFTAEEFAAIKQTDGFDLPNSDPTRDGYDFLGWALSETETDPNNYFIEADDGSSTSEYYETEDEADTEDDTDTEDEADTEDDADTEDEADTEDDADTEENASEESSEDADEESSEDADEDSSEDADEESSVDADEESSEDADEDSSEDADEDSSEDAAPLSYTVNVVQVDGGRISLKTKTFSDEEYISFIVGEEEEVEVSVITERNYKLMTLFVEESSDGSGRILLNNQIEEYFFTPWANVTVSATYEEIEEEGTDPENLYGDEDEDETSQDGEDTSEDDSQDEDETSEEDESSEEDDDTSKDESSEQTMSAKAHNGVAVLSEMPISDAPTAPVGIEARYSALTFDTYVIADADDVENVEFIYAIWEEKTDYAVTYEYDGGKTAGSSDTSSVQENLKWLGNITLPTVTKEEYLFAGWKLTAIDGTDVTNNTVITDNMTFSQLVDSDTKEKVTLTAQWVDDPTVEVILDYVLYFHKNDGTSGLVATVKGNGGYISFPSAPTSSDSTKEFKGWGISETSTSYVTSGKFENLAKIPVYSDPSDKDTFTHFEGNLYAIWGNKATTSPDSTPDTTTNYTVTFYKNDGTSSKVSTETSTTSTKNVDFPSDPSRSGYTFKGWATSASGTTATTGKTFAQLATTKSGDNYVGSLYAIWDEDSTTGGGSGSTGGGSSSGGSSSSGSSSSGSSSSGSSSSSSSTSSTVTSSTSGDKETVTISKKPTVTSSTVTTTVTKSDVDEAISAATTSSPDVLVSPDYIGTSKDFDFALDRDALQAFRNSSAETLSFDVGGTIVTFDQDAVNFILKNTLEQTVLSVDMVANLSQEAVDAFGSRKLFNFSMVSDGENVIEKLEEGLMKITFPQPNLIGNIIAGMVTETGDIEYRGKSFYDGETLKVFAEYFGIYGVARRENTDLISVFDEHWAKEYVQFTDTRRLYETMSTIEPEEEITRGMFVTILGLLEQVEEGDLSQATYFTDISTEESYSSYVQWAYENGIVAGKGDQVFAPDDEISREEMAVMLMAYIRYLEIGLEEKSAASTFVDDTEISDWAKTSVEQAQKYGLVEGKTGNDYDPKGLTTYGEHAVMIMGLVDNLLSVNTIHLD